MRIAISGMVCAALAASCAAPTKATSDGPKVDQLDFELMDLGGAVVRPSDFVDKVVLVDFWATWCTPCEASFPFYDALSKQYGPKGLVVLGVSVDTDDDAVRRFLSHKPVSFRILRDPTGSVPERLDLDTMPTAVLIGRDGAVREVHKGFVSGDEATMTAFVEAALAADEAPGGPRTEKTP